MRVLLIFFALFYLGTTWAQSYNRWNYQKPLSEFDLLQNSINFSARKAQQNVNTLQTVKYLMLNGRLDEASIVLNTFDPNSDDSLAIKYRYFALLKFLEGKYTEAEKILDRPLLLELGHYSKICLLRSLNYVLLDKNLKAKASWKRCKLENLPHLKNGYAWFQTFLDLKVEKKSVNEVDALKELKIDNVEGNELIMFLKLALYLGRQKSIIPRFQFLGQESLENPRVRELLGLNYFRDGQIKKAYLLIEDLETANAEIFKGNIYLAQKKYELAYAQYKLALDIKSNSQNAFERLLPLTWVLKQWREGILFLKQLQFKPARKNEALSLEAALYSQLQEYEKSTGILLQVRKSSNFVENLENTQILSYNFLAQGNIPESQNYAEKSCALNDGLNCWLAFKLEQWPQINQYIENNSRVHQRQSPLYKELFSGEVETFKDKKYIDQRDVDYLDNNLIKLR